VADKPKIKLPPFEENPAAGEIGTKRESHVLNSKTLHVDPTLNKRTDINSVHDKTPPQTKSTVWLVKADSGSDSLSTQPISTTRFTAGRLAVVTTYGRKVKNNVSTGSNRNHLFGLCYFRNCIGSCCAKIASG